MGNWKKAMAIIATVPMLMTLAPAANAADAPTQPATQTAAAQQALQAAVAQTTTAATSTAAAKAAKAAEGPSDLANYTNDANLIADYNFNDVKADQTGTLTDATKEVKATINGKAAVTTNATDKSTALTLGAGNWLNLTNADGSAVLGGRHAVTISYDSQANQTTAGWSVFAAPNATAQTYGKEHYLGVMDQTGKITAERYNNTSGRNSDANVSGTSNANWKHVDIVVADEFSALYVDGKQQAVSTKTSGATLPAILGDNGGVLQIGKGNWVNGEYFTGAIDNLKIYDATDAAVTDVLNNLTIADTATKDFTVPVASNGVAIAWTSDNAAITIDAKTGKATVKRPAANAASDVKVTLTASPNKAEDYTFTVTVPREESNDVKAQADLAAIDLGSLTDVRSDITLPTTGEKYGSDIVWTSSAPTVISDTVSDKGAAPGVVTRNKDGDKIVVLTARVKGSELTRRFVATVKQAPAKAASEATEDYLFAHFTGTEGRTTDEQIYFATSKDGSKWIDTHTNGNPVLTWDKSQTGNSRGKDDGVRDPYLVRSPEGDTVYLIATELSIHNRGGWGAAAATSTGSPNLIVWESHDMVTWSQPRAVDVASKIPDAGMAWAPEAYWDNDKQQYMVYWATASDASNESGDHTNMYYSTTRDFVHFSDPVKWIDRTLSVIDTTMIKADDGYYYRVSGDTYLGIERSKNPYATTTTTGGSLTSMDGYYNTGDDPDQWTLVGTFGDLTGTGLTGRQLEGPELFFYSTDDIQTNAAGKKMKYGLMWDQYSSGKGYTPYRSADLGSTDKNDWGFASDVNFGSLKKRHGTILPITAAEYQAIMDTYNGKDDVTNNYATTAADKRSLTVLDANDRAASEATIAVGENATFTAVANDPDDALTSVKWEVKDASKVEMAVQNAKSRSVKTNEATFTGKQVGTTTVTATSTEDPSLTATFTIHVVKADLDYSKLQAAIDAAGTKKEADYTADSWNTFAAALGAARAMLTNDNATQKDVNAAASALVSATEALKAKPSTPVEPGGKPSEGDGNGGKTDATGKADAQSESAGSNTSMLSRTGVAVGAVALVAVALAGAGVALELRRRRS
ncbi:immunoglobulin-like domain-containing protein [Bifidobacterium catulorum]|uniref:Atrophied bacterial Ig domain-containing protein n=1 Tax=Bifidobacterium catulorum TaxID=1630173 RepID=A0A2U2MQN3_9BIFI|nr:immunoglobulin-like domain-containing protein [Bifidobacterium catulorum]PWG59162.1 hypothetical protein DF200_09040 [Bifidobacterium catulorum]